MASKHTANNSPLESIRVVDFTTALAGPYCTQILGDLGADVIKIERPGTGDQSRGWGPPFIGEVSAYFCSTNRNKRSLTLDLNRTEGRAIFEQLLKTADVLVVNIPRQASRKKLGVDQEHCLSLNPRLIWACITGFGNSGPYAEKPGYDIIAQGMSGTMHVTGEPEHGPIRFPTPIADLTAGIYTALAIVAALFYREKTGQGQAIDTALLDSQITWLSILAGAHLATGEPIKKMGNAHPSIVPYQVFPTADGWIMVAVGNDHLWGNFVQAIEMPELAREDRFKTNPQRVAHRQELIPVLMQRFRQFSTKHWLERLEAAGIPAGPIKTPESSLRDDQIIARGMIVELEHPVLGKIRMLGNPINLSRSPVSYRLPPPLLGEHNHEILKELNYSDEEIESFKNEGII